MNTPRRTIRIEDELWTAAAAKADEEDTTVTEVIRKALSAYVKGAAALVVLVTLLAACGGAQVAGTQPVEPTASQPVVAVTSEPVESKPLGEAFTVPEVGTVKVSTLDEGVYGFEVMTTELVIFDGEFVGVDSAGVEHVGSSLAREQHGQPFRTNGVGGDQIRFGTDDIVSITYTDHDLVITWAV